MNNHVSELDLRSDLVCAGREPDPGGGRGSGRSFDGWMRRANLIAVECIGVTRARFVDRAARYASEREIVGPQAGQNQHPVRDRVGVRSGRAADLMRFRAAQRSDAAGRVGPGGEHGRAAGVQRCVGAANACVDTHGGNGFNAEFDVERKFRETRADQVAPTLN